MSKTIAEKLQITPHTTVWAVGPRSAAAPHAHAGRRPRNRQAGDRQHRDPVRRRRRERPQADDGARRRRNKPAVFWVAYPKGNKSDINRDSLWPIVAEFGMRPNGQVAIDDHWSALRFRANREGEAEFTGGATIENRPRHEASNGRATKQRPADARNREPETRPSRPTKRRTGKPRVRPQRPRTEPPFTLMIWPVT